MAYQARIVKLENIRPIVGADRIVVASASGYDVIVNVSSKEGDIVVLFVDDGQLSEQYANANDLVGYKDPVTGERKGGFFPENRRVKAIRFKGVKSEAYVATLESLSFTGYNISKLSVGDAFDTLNDIPICNKYYTPATLKRKNDTPKISSDKKIKEELKKKFPEHKDTEQFRFATADKLANSLVTITSKLHGTSARQTFIEYPTEHEIKNPFKLIWNVIVDEILHGKRHLLNCWTTDIKAARMKFYPKVTYSWEHVYGTRRVVKGVIDETSKDYRHVSASKIKPFVNKNECWYYEIVGYEDTGAAIMQSVSTKEMGKEFVKRFGQTITYKYGCLPETCDIYVYRITVQNADGVVYELPWGEVKNRCRLAGIKHVPEIEQRVVRNDVEVDMLKKVVEYYTEDVDIAEPIDPSHIREGVCVRVDNLDTGKSTIWKNKTFTFKCLEGIIKNSDSYVDSEEMEG